MATGFLAPGDLRLWRERLEPVVGSAVAVVDLGCGTGRFGRALAAQLSAEVGRSLSYIGVDICPATCAFAVADLDWPGRASRFVCADLNRWAPEESESPALVLSNDALYLASDPAAVLSRLAPACAALAFSVYVGDDQHDGGVCGRSLETWEAWLRSAGFRGLEALDVTPAWREIAGRIHRVRLDALAEIAQTYGPEFADRTGALAARFLGLDGRPGFLARTERVILTAGGPRS